MINDPGPNYAGSWNTGTASSGPHTLSATAIDEAGNSATSSITITVNSSIAPIPGASVALVTSSGATIIWTTVTPSNSQVAYGLTKSYGSLSGLGASLSTAHSMDLTGLNPSTTYHFQVLSQDAQGNLATSTDFTFTTVAVVAPLLELNTGASEVSGVTNGAVVTPSTAPAGFTGTVVVNGSGSVNFAPAVGGSGVYFQSCCANANNAFYRFTGSMVGNIFNVNQGQVTFYLKSQYSFAQRQASGTSPRVAFAVQDNNANTHLFYFLTEYTSGHLTFAYATGGGAQFYFVPTGTEDALFGSGQVMQVTLTWTGGVAALYLNGVQVQTGAYTIPTPNWTSASRFDLGASEYPPNGGYYSSDDIIDEFTVTGPPIALDTTPPVVAMTAPANGATVSGSSVTVSANATDNVAVASVQFQVDGTNLGSALTGAGPSYSVSWDSTTVVNGTHTLSAVASDAAGNTATSSVSVTANNPVVPPMISAVAAGSITSSGATITWTTDQTSNSQVAYGLNSSYGSLSALGAALVTAHTVVLTGLNPSTLYHYQVLSQNGQGNLATSTDFTFTTVAVVAPLLQLHADATEVSGVTNGAVVTPSTAPAGFTGTVVVNGSGSVNFAPAVVGNGVFFQSCCANANNAFYRFTGSMVGNIFNVNQGQVTFYLKSQYSFAQRQASGTSPRVAFAVQDNNANTHLFYFLTEYTSGHLTFAYATGGGAQFYFVPTGTEDALFGSGQVMQVTLTWTGGVAALYLNGVQVQTGAYTIPTPNWTPASRFDLGASEYPPSGGYYSSDDIINEFTVTGPPIVLDTTPPVVAMTAPASLVTVSGNSVTVSANATDNVAVASVQFRVDETNLGSAVTGTGPSYSLSWDSTTVVNGTHTLSAMATDASGNTATSSVSVTVNNPLVPPVISAVAAGSISSSGATITWTTDQTSNSQVAYGLNSSYGSLSALGAALVTAHTVVLTGLNPSTLYHYQVLSQNGQGNLATSTDFTFTTVAVVAPLLQLHADATEVSGVTNGAVVTPSTAPAGFTGTVVVNGSGSVNFAPAVVGNGVFFQSCCANANNAFYRFTGSMVGNIFNVNQGQVTFYLKSQYSFAQRQASGTSPQVAFAVQDNNANTHLFYFLTEYTSGHLTFAYATGGGAQFYFVPTGTEDALFGSGQVMQVTLTWTGGVAALYLNGVQVQTGAYTIPTPNWTSASRFDLGASEYPPNGGYYSSDDIINEFTVTGPPIALDTTPPVVAMTAPANGATVSGSSVTVSANATDNVAVASVQFQVDGTNLGSALTGAGPSYSVSWDSTTVVNGTHTLSAVASDAAGNTATSSVSVTVNNPLVPPVISAVSAGSISSSGATITWTTDQASNSQAAYGLNSSYGSLSALGAALVTAHTVVLTGLSPSTMYHYQVLSQNGQGNLATSTDFTFTTVAVVAPLLQLHADATEVSGVTNGAVVTPSTAPAGFTGTVVVNGSGSVNFAPAVVGNGVFFQSCCANANNAFYRFTGSMVGNIFNVNQGQVTFYLKSQYSFAQRQASGTSPRVAFAVQDNNANTHLFYFLTEYTSGHLTFAYATGGGAQFYFVPTGTEDALFGSGQVMQVTLTWTGGVAALYLNGVQVQTGAYTIPTPNWTSASRFDLGASDYPPSGGYYSSDDIINEFTVTGPPIALDTTPPVVAMTAPANGATVSGSSVTVSANATDNVAVASVQFQVDGTNLGSALTGAGPSYSVSWDSTTVVNGTHTLSAVASDAAGNTATSSVSVTANNPVVPPMISAVAARLHHLLRGHHHLDHGPDVELPGGLRAEQLLRVAERSGSGAGDGAYRGPDGSQPLHPVSLSSAVAERPGQSGHFHRLHLHDDSRGPPAIGGLDSLQDERAGQQQ